MSVYRAQLTEALGAVAIRGPLRYAWLGRASRPVPAAALDEPTRHAYLRAWLQHELYASFYCRGRVVPARFGEPLPGVADAALVRELDAANAGRDRREPGWTVERRAGLDAVVTREGLRARVAAADCRPDGDGTVSLPLPALTELSPGFLSLSGDAGEPAGPGVLRAYWHVTRRGAGELVRALTSELNARALPYRLKVADHPLRFDRCDAAVLYLRPDDLAALRPWLLALARGLTSRLRPAVPAFTLPLAPGLGLAEDDNAPESFGERRCGWLADGLLAAHEVGSSPFDAVLARLAAEGVDIDAPYREPALAGRHVL